MTTGQNLYVFIDGGKWPGQLIKVLEEERLGDWRQEGLE